MRIRIAVPDAHVTPEVLEAALEATTAANHAMLESGDVEPISHSIRKGKVKWKPETFTDGEHFDLSDTVQKRGWGDCDDLAPALAAELRATGRDPDARAIVKRSGPNLWHAVTQTSDGRILDPSKAAGMGGRDGSKYVLNGEVRGLGLNGTSVMGMVSDGAVLGLKPHQGKWASRCDLPLEGYDAAISGVALASSPLMALERAIRSATCVGAASELVSDEDIARALAIHAAASGNDYGEALRAYGQHLSGEELGSIFSSISKGLKSALPMAANFIPIPGAGLAAQMATKLIPGGGKGGGGGHGGGGGGGGGASPHPGGVTVTKESNGAIVVRF
jgi:hypothetical protein